MVASHYFIRLKRLSTPQSSFFFENIVKQVWSEILKTFLPDAVFFCLKPLHCLKEMRTHKMRENINHKSTCMDTCSDDLRINLCAFFRDFLFSKGFLKFFEISNFYEAFSNFWSFLVFTKNFKFFEAF